MEYQAITSLIAIQNYLKRQQLKVQKSDGADINLAICIPAYKEQNLTVCLESLGASCKKTYPNLKVFVCLNAPEGDYEAQHLHKQQKEELEAKSFPFRVEFIFLEAPVKKAGVGLARKTVMDYALCQIAANKEFTSNFLLTLDGDCRVNENYLETIYGWISDHPKATGASVNVQHELSEAFAGNQEAIMRYEMHLRLYRMWQQFTGHPYATHTIGSAMLINCDAYAKQGGMNTRKAGEDFYLINKLNHLGAWFNITETTVYADARISTRVPFGTGRAMQQAAKGEEINTYNPENFKHLKELYSALCQAEPKWQKLSKITQELLEPFEVVSKHREILENLASEKLLKKKVFQRFDLFVLMKMLHFLRDQYYPNVSLEQSYEAMTQYLGEAAKSNLKEQLAHSVEMDLKMQILLNNLN